VFASRHYPAALRDARKLTVNRRLIHATFSPVEMDVSSTDQPIPFERKCPSPTRESELAVSMIATLITRLSRKAFTSNTLIYLKELVMMCRVSIATAFHVIFMYL
jgi:hypothetical protein